MVETTGARDLPQRGSAYPYVLIGLSGKAGSGKNTVADIICDLVPGAEQYALAGPLKKMALAIDPLIWEDPEYRIKTHLAELVAEYGWDYAKQLPEVRRFLQRLGTDGVRGTFGENVWVDLMLDWWEVTPARVGVITDVRFPNELARVDVSVKVVRPNGNPLDGELAQHVSEQDLPTDFIIRNDAGIAELSGEVLELLAGLGIPVSERDRFAAL